MKPLGVGTIFGSGMGDGPFPEHYEPLESPVLSNLMSKKHRVNPTIPIARLQAMAKDPSFLFSFDTERYPIVATTYRVSEHWQTGVMTRHLPWLLEMQPEMFVEMSLELAAEKGIRNGDAVSVTSARGEVSGVAIVRTASNPQGHGHDDPPASECRGAFGWQYPADGSGGDSANLLIPFMGDPNTLIPESKAFMFNIRKIAGRRAAMQNERGSHDRTKILFHRPTKCTGCRGCRRPASSGIKTPQPERASGGRTRTAGPLGIDLQAGEICGRDRPVGDPNGTSSPPVQALHLPALQMAPTRGFRGQTPLDPTTRAVLYNPVKVSPEDFKAIREMCPFDIPRHDEKSGGWRSAPCASTGSA
jgi:hypothetical protein